jgi:hypothetical protein
MEAAAFSGWPSIRAATASGSLDPAAAAAATARAAEEPTAGHGDVGAHGDGQAVMAGHVDGHRGGQMGGVGGQV